MTRPRSALVIGTGLAGSAVAAMLARRGWHVTVIGRERDPAQASAVPAAVMAPPVGVPSDPLSRMRRRGAACTRAWLDRLERAGLDAGRVADGVTIRPAGERARARHARIAPADPRVRALAPGSDSVHHALGACVRPAMFAAGLRTLAGPRPEFLPGRVERLAHEGGHWVALDAVDEPFALAEDLIVAAGAASGHLLPRIRHLLHPARGQATAFAATAGSNACPLPLSGGGYITPAIDGLHWAGATLQRGDTDVGPREIDDATNLEFAREQLALDARPQPADRFVGIRATTPNRIPLVGACDNRAWISAGHGAHGLLTACLAAHLIADALAGRDHPWLRLTAPLRRRDRGRTRNPHSP